MDEHENNTKSEAGTKNNTTGKQQNNPLEDLNLDGFNIPDWLKHLLSGAGALGANYFLFIKPMQDKMEAMQDQISKQKDKIKELEHEQDRLILQLNNEAKEKRKQSEDDLFTTKRNHDTGGRSPSYSKSIHL